MSKLFLKNFIFFFLILILSFFFFRGRIGSDDLEVFNFVFNFKNFQGNIFDFLSELKNSKSIILYSDDLQKHSYYTWHHRFIWIIQTYIIYSLVDFFNLFFQIKSIFFHKYFSGFILTFYSVLSFFLCIKYYYNKNLNLIFCFLLCVFIFFSTGLITFFTGQYIESLVVLLIVCRIYTKNITLIFFLDFVLILIKPFYFIIVFFLRIKDFNSNKIFNKTNYQIAIIILILLFLLLLFRILITDSQNNLNYISSQNPNFSLFDYFKNFIAFYFSHGGGIFFTLLPLVILIYFGREKKTKFKVLSIIFISFFLSIYNGSHGSVSGGRYSLPFFIIFLDEYFNAFKIIINRNRLILILISILTFFNLPALEYRNFIVSEYQNKTIISKTPLGPVQQKNVDNKIKFLLYNWPIYNIKFNNIVFSNLVLYSKLLNNKYVQLNEEIIIETDFIFPQTGIARLIYLNNQKIDSGYIFVNYFSNKFIIFFKLIYYFTIILFLSFYFFAIFKSLKIKNKHE